jgi:Family of unknown function (DUF6152)
MTRIFAMTALIASITAVATLPAPASAHHSPALLFDLQKQVTIEGIVTRFELGNPHVRIYFRPNGAQTEWMAEGGSRTVLLHHGWTDDEMKPGDHVAIVGNPSRDGSNIVHVVQITLPDGRKLGTEDFQPETIEAARARRAHP